MVQENELKQLQDLARQWETGDALAGNKFIERIQPLVRYQIRNLSYGRFASRVDTNDLGQIVLQKISEVAARKGLCRNITEFFYAWLQRFVKNIVTREIRNHCAQKRDWRRQSEFDESTCNRFRDQRESLSLKHEIEEILCNLTPEDRELARHLACGSSQTEIAASLNVHPRTVRRRISELRKPFANVDLVLGLTK
ncbi:sigma-70 family RNA polymerase sigma factor [Mariniblastus sp.]|nr:sigma-70 family RNA polymerase sigma factor [Mariniblastus sp.]